MYLLSIYVFVVLAVAFQVDSSVLRGRSVDPFPVDDDTVVPLGSPDEQTEVLGNGRRVRRNAPNALNEIMNQLSRDKATNMDEYQRSNAVYDRMRSIHRLLQLFIGWRGPRVEIRQFVNWDITITIDHLFYVRPATIWDVRYVIKAASLLGLRIRATGAGHTRSPLYTDEGHIMMDVRALQRHDGPWIELHKPTAARNFYTVTAMTGVYEYDLNTFLVQNKLAMLSQPLNVNETVGGMVAASTHGSTWDAPTWSGYVVEMRLMDARGRLRRFTIERQPELMKALMCNLGMMGIMYDITIQVYPTRIAKVTNDFVSLGSLFFNKTNLRNVVTGNFMTEISWYPFNSVTPEEERQYETHGTVPSNWSVQNDLVWLRSTNIVDSVDESQIKGPIFLPTKGSLSGGNVTGLLRGKAAISIARKMQHTTYHQLVDAFPVILPPRHGTETSAAFLLNVDTDFDRPTRAFEFMANKVENQIKNNASTPLNAFLPRFFKNMDCYLCFGNNDIKSPNDSGRSLVIDFLAPPTQYGFYPTAEEFVNNFRNENVRPHWAKRHTNIPNIINILHKTYGANLGKFTTAKYNTGIDTCDMFMNSYLLEVFGRSPYYWSSWC